MTGEPLLATITMPDNGHLVPCPYCGLVASHRGDCELGLMRTGEFYLVVAIRGERIEQAEPGAGSHNSPATVSAAVGRGLNPAPNGHEG